MSQNNDPNNDKPTPTPVKPEEESKIVTTPEGWIGFSWGPPKPDMRVFGLRELDEVYWERIQEKRHSKAQEPVFPRHVLKGLLGEWSLFMSDEIFAPPEFYYLNALTFLGNALKNKRGMDFEEGGMKVWPHLYTLLVGPPGCGKGTALRHSLDFFRKLEWLIHGQIHVGVNSAEGLITAAKEDNGGFALAIDEFSAFIKKAQIDNAILVDMVNTLFEITEYEKLKANPKDNAKVNTLLSLASTIQTDRWIELAGGELYKSGFCTRFLYARKEGSPRKTGTERKTPDEDTKQKFITRFEGLWRRECDEHAHLRPFTYHVTKEGRAKWLEWWMGIPTDDAATRLDTIGKRLMILLAFEMGKTEIDLEVVESVIALLDWQYDVRKALTPSQAQGYTARCIETIINTARNAGGKISVRDLQKNGHLNKRYPDIWPKCLEDLTTPKAGVKRATTRMEGKTQMFELIDE